MLKEIPFQAGQVADLTDVGVGKLMRWKAMDKVRFFEGKPRTIGGWTLRIAGLLGACRSMSDWQTLSAQIVTAFGTHRGVQLFYNGLLYGIGPTRKTTNPMSNNPFAVVTGTPTVTVTDTSHGATVGDVVVFSGASAVSGVTINGTWIVATVVNANSYTFTAAQNAGSTTSGGGAAAIATYWLNIGPQDTTSPSGFGAGTYGSGAWNAPRASTGVAQARTWSFDQWGEDLIINPSGGGVYIWDASVGFGSNATLITQAPATAIYTFLTSENRQIVCLGAHDGSNPDPMLVRWCHKEDYTTWAITATNTAGSKRLDLGSYLVCAAKISGGYLIFSNSHLWLMTFVGPSDIFAWGPPIDNGGIVGPQAYCVAFGNCYWMGQSDFFVYSQGTVQPIVCPVHRNVFDHISSAQRVKTQAAFNRQFNEIWWFYQSDSGSDVDSYVIYNLIDKSWATGTINRTSFVGDSDVISTPYATDLSGAIYDHETGVDANAQPLNPYIESGDVMIEDGEYMIHVGKMILDFVRDKNNQYGLSGSALVTVKAKSYPADIGAQIMTKGPLVVSPSTKYIEPRVRGRQLSIRIESNDIGDAWHLGMVRVDAQPDGKR